MEDKRAAELGSTASTPSGFMHADESGGARPAKRTFLYEWGRENYTLDFETDPEVLSLMAMLGGGGELSHSGGSYQDRKSSFCISDETSSGSKDDRHTRLARDGDTLTMEDSSAMTSLMDRTHAEGDSIAEYMAAPDPVWKCVTNWHGVYSKKSTHDRKYSFITLPREVLREGEQSGWGLTVMVYSGSRPRLCVEAFQVVITVFEYDVIPTGNYETQDQSVRLRAGRVPHVRRVAEKSPDFNAEQKAYRKEFQTDDECNIDSVWLNTTRFTDKLDEYARKLSLPKDGTAYLTNAIRTHMINDTNVWDEFRGLQVRFANHWQAHRQRKLERKGNKNMENKKADKRKRE
ncbi:hypothetical protein QFC21_005907 [Naganishia friedmannii]|uniref:Uncharacterized protein n=1 Tax=Naganishia friedmannii TaxID=89922 RepID=A0ACC2V5X3_9TREE|nr:hypothetical protein QFC21_005907 [Naganishia friedmannii]